MALSNSQSTSTVFLSVVGGKISQKVKPETPGAVKRVNKMGNDIYELQFSKLSGILKNVKLKEDDTYGNQYEIYLEDVGEGYVLQMPQSGRLASSFLSRLPNMDRTGYIEIGTWATEEDGKTKQFLTVRQNDKVVPPYFSKDNPNGLPPLEQKKVKGQLVWDDSEQIEFYKELVKKTFSGEAPIKHDIVDAEDLDAVFKKKEEVKAPF
jgi:hypothetical protein